MPLKTSDGLHFLQVEFVIGIAIILFLVVSASSGALHPRMVQSAFKTAARDLDFN
jgi:hypothetical protein